MPIKRPDNERYEIDQVTGCWNYTMSLHWNGYGQYYRKEEDGSYNHLNAHHHYFELYKGKVPKGMAVDHLCRNRKCVNPDHLEMVTPAENARRRPSTKLSPLVVQKIRMMCKEGVRQNKIALLFKIHQCQVSRINGGLRWAGV